MKKLLLTIFLVCTVCAKSSLFADVDDTNRVKIPSSYFSRCEKEGTTTLLQYKMGNLNKTAIVYTPYGYDSEDKDTRYPVLFLMHGGGGTGANYIGPAKSPNSLCWLIDNMIYNGEIPPVIIVCPNHGGSFHLELRKGLIPALDAAFNTEANRESRIIGGFSMGAVATWDVFLHDLDLVKYFIPMSGDSWVCGSTGGKTFPEKTAEILANSDKIEEYNDFKIFAATGLNDMAYANLTPQINAMMKLSDTFVYTNEDFTEGNLMYYVVKGNVHAYNHTYEYIYNALKYFPLNK